MKSTLKVSISGIAFNLEDDAYQLLKDYLDKLSVHFNKSEGGKEIIDDIEARLAELLLTKIKTAEQSVTVKDVHEVIAILGKPEELDDDSNSKDINPPHTFSVSAKKRLYRDPDNQVVSGVCGGLGAYFNIDPIIFRILFVALTLSGSFFWFMNLSAIAVILYIVLWISLPKALSIAQKLEMRGESPSVANMERKMREEASKSPASTQPKRTVLGNLIRTGFYIFAAIIAIPIICVGIALIIAFIAVTFAGGWILHDNIFPIMDFVAIAGTNLTFIKILSLIVITIPLLLLVYAGIRLLFRFKTKSRGIIISLVAIWVICSFGLIGSAGYALKDYRQGAKITTKEVLPTNSDTLYVNIPQHFGESNERFYIGWSNDGRHNHIPYLWINEQNDQLSIFPKVDVYYVDDSTFNISYTRSARAKSRGFARNKAESLPVQYNITDSLITIIPHQFTKDYKWSGESGNLKIYVPNSKNVILSSDIEGDNDRFHSHYHWDDEFTD